MNVQIESSWKRQLESEFKKNYFNQLVDYVKSEYSSNTVYPPGHEIFGAFDHCSFDDLKVVILGQDPYHGSRQANGLCFSVNKGVRKPPSLQNIFKELHTDINKPIPLDGDLTNWADQGVLLLNATLTVRAHSPGSHQGKGWEQFTDRIIKLTSDQKTGVVYLLWGAYAQKKAELIDEKKHLILTSPHPSPFSANRGFFGNKHFSKTNDYLKGTGRIPIKW